MIYFSIIFFYPFREYVPVKCSYTWNFGYISTIGPVFPPFTSKLIFYSYFHFETPHLAISLIFIAFFAELQSLELMVNTDILNSITPFIFQLVPLLINKSKESCLCLVCGSFYTVHVVHMINIFYSVWLEACKHL